MLRPLQGPNRHHPRVPGRFTSFAVLFTALITGQNPLCGCYHHLDLSLQGNFGDYPHLAENECECFGGTSYLIKVPEGEKIAELRYGNTFELSTLYMTGKIWDIGSRFNKNNK